MILYESKQTEFSLDLNVEGSQQQPSSIRLFLESSNYDIVVNGTKSGKTFSFNIPPVFGLINEDKIRGHVEVVIEDKHFVLKDKTFVIERDIKLEGEINEKTKDEKEPTPIEVSEVVDSNDSDETDETDDSEKVVTETETDEDETEEESKITNKDVTESIAKTKIIPHKSISDSMKTLKTLLNT